MKRYDDFSSQQSCWEWVCSGNTIIMNGDTKIRFIYGRLCAIVDGKWTPCPITFEHPNTFSKESQ